MEQLAIDEPTSGSAAFDTLRMQLTHTPQLRSEVESALRLLVDRVDPGGRGARFVVGAAVEWILGAAAWSAGVLTAPAGHNANGFDLVDLLDKAQGLWSVKSSFQPKGTAFRISNGMGGGGKGFIEPTVFVHPALPGLVYVDPQLHADVSECASVKSDAVVLPFAPILRHALARPECVAPLVVSPNEHKGKEDPALSFTQGLLGASMFPRLAAMFEAAQPSNTSTIADKLFNLASMKDNGLLSDDEYLLAKTRLLTD